jgi:hypothetical protein
MTAMAKYPNIPDHEAECTSYFKSVIADIPIYREAAIIDTDGKSIHCSTLPQVEPAVTWARPSCSKHVAASRDFMQNLQ